MSRLQLPRITHFKKQTGQSPLAVRFLPSFDPSLPLVADGMAGFGEIMKNKPAGGFKAKVVRAFQDGNFVVAHTEYDFFGPKIGFDIFRFEDGLIVEHWDVIEPLLPDEQRKNSNGKFGF